MGWNNIGNLFGGNRELWERPSFNPTGKPNSLKSAPPVSEYHGGTLSIAITPADSQRDVVNRGLLSHAKKAGLSDQPSVAGGKSPAQMFADQWTTDKLRHRKSGAEYTEAEFLGLKKNKTTTFSLSEANDADVLADLNSRIEALKETDVVKVNTNVELTLEERAAALMAKAGVNGANSSLISSKPLATPASVDALGGTVRNAEDALREHVKQNYNPHNRVWGDKINEVLSQAKQDGITVDNLELVTDENGNERASFTISPANKAKLDKLFAQALNETKKGEWGSDEGQREGTRMLGDLPIMGANGVINTANHTSEPVRGTLESLGVDTSAAKLPKLPYQSEYGKKNGGAGEIGTEIGLGIAAAPSVLETTAGKVLFGVSGSYNIAAGTAGIDPTEKDKNGQPRQMGALERGMRVVGGAGEIAGAQPSFATAGKTGTTLAQESETVEALTPDGQIVKAQVPKSAQTATESATAKPVQTADDLALEMRGEHRINIRKGDGTKSSGMEYAWRRHGGSGSLINKSQFSIPREEVEAILQRKDIIKSPAILDIKSGNYIRQVDVGKTVGNVPLKQGGHPTSVITIITDEAGNLVNIFPGRLDFGATLP